MSCFLSSFLYFWVQRNERDWMLNFFFLLIFLLEYKSQIYQLYTSNLAPHPLQKVLFARAQKLIIGLESDLQRCFTPALTPKRIFKKIVPIWQTGFITEVEEELLFSVSPTF